jgi:hypothetical protein
MTDAEFAPGVAGSGLKLHCEIAGPPEQVRFTALGNDPFTGNSVKL